MGENMELFRPKEPSRISRVGLFLRDVFIEPNEIDTSHTLITFDDEMLAQMTPEAKKLIETFYLPENFPEEERGLKYHYLGKENGQFPL